MFQTNVVEKIKTHYVFSNFFFLKTVPFMRKCEKNIVERGRLLMTIWRMRIACWIPKDKKTHTQQQWLHERASIHTDIISGTGNTFVWVD